MDKRQSWYTWLSTLTLTVIVFKLFQSICFRRNKNFFKEKVVVITGASSGIGESLAHTFYRLGCKVILCARRRQELERVQNDLLQMHSTVPVHPPVIMQVDLCNIDTFDQIVWTILDITGHIDILVNNGGISCRGSINDTSNKVFMNLMMVNYFGTVAFTKAILPHMISRKQGHIVFMSSLQGLMAIPHRAAYGASKHAIQAFSDSLRAEVAEDNINVTVVSPGYVRTSLSMNALTESGVKLGKMDSALSQGYDPNYIAEKTALAILRNRNEIVLAPLLHRIAAVIRSNVPSLYFLIMEYRAKNSKDE
ncbi:hypothetical protein RN001_008505 [Aquatica leii]|uniref:Dehydrogenase/reductase SDR family protein 7-like n=1 Tax=Aquatica leii TaxID=1421715 RepID=A0AAN7PAE2_9COLE|nr:hypothetical protein RN001_008505 [Aquatica leii]